MKKRALISLLMAVSCASGALAQAVRPPAPPACELHFWPASAVDTYPRPAQAQGGPVWALALGGKKRAEGLMAVRSEIASILDAQGSLLAIGRDGLAARLGLQPSMLIVHEGHLVRQTLRLRRKHQVSNSPCYSELIVTSILYKNGSFGGHFLETAFMLREFGSGSEPSRVTNGGGLIRLSSYPAKEGEDTEAANADLNAAFRQGFEAFLAKTKKPLF